MRACHCTLGGTEACIGCMNNQHKYNLSYGLTHPWTQYIPTSKVIEIAETMNRLWEEKENGNTE